MTENLKLKENIKKLCDSLDMDYQLNFVKKYSQIGDSQLYGGKHCGSDAEHKGSEFIAEKLRQIGVSNVELVPCSTGRYQFNDATIKAGGYEIKPYGYVSPGTAGETWNLEVIDTGKATKEECEAADISGKAVLFAAMGTLEGGNLAGQMEEAIRSGAKAVIIYAVEDVLNDETIRVQPPNIISSVPIVGICGKDAEYLKKKIEEGSCTIELHVDAEYIPGGGTTYNVVGEIPGELSDEKIIYTAHLDHYFRCLQDNISTCATLLGIAKGIIDSGIKPERTIVFAFHGSHETGGADTRYPYIYGSYKLANEDKKEWSGSAVANINFEYTALAQKKLQMPVYMGSGRTVKEYFPYAPELTGGFEEKNDEALKSEYYMLSWSDSISYHNAGIPAIMNDPITEQLYEGKGPYVGRDHSNFDNWEVFDKKALADTDRVYGALGLYISSMPYVTIDFTEQTDRIKNEVDFEMLKSLGMNTEAYMEAVNRLDKAGTEINELTEHRNREYLEADAAGTDMTEKKKRFDEAAAVNAKILEAYRIIAKELDKINQLDFLSLATVKYIQNIQLLHGAAEYIKAGDSEKALTECLASVDLCLSSYLFRRDVAEHMQKQICDPAFADRRTWAAGRELNVSANYDMMQTFKEEAAAGAGFAGTLKYIEEAVAKEISYIPEAMAAEITTMNKAAEILEGI